jgi:tRNA threonylcarbamoyladenosine biosynthesis protein TsaE
MLLEFTLEELPKVALKLKAYLSAYKIIAFYGDMGVGKTTLIKEILHQCGVKENVSSPTFSLVNEYSNDKGEIFYHFDFYRIKSIEEVYDIGYEDYFYSGHVCLIEWPEKIETLLPDEILKVIITLHEQKRSLELIKH